MKYWRNEVNALWDNKGSKMTFLVRVNEGRSVYKGERKELGAVLRRAE